jgi:thiamine transporter
LKQSNLKAVTECGMLMATALALSYFKVFQMPGGGSVSFSCLPLFLLAARHGLHRGVACCGLYGLLLLINSPTILHPIQFLMDYPLAYASIGVSGAVLWNTPLKAVTATTAANFIRLHFHVIAGAVYFSANSNTAKQALIASYAYNLSHLLPEIIISATFAFFLIKNQKRLCERQR